jgi:hypothetical protein
MQLISKNKFIPWLLCLLLIVQGIGFYKIAIIFAAGQNATTSAAINNKAPVISGHVAENPASTAAAPAIVGGSVIFQVTATDQNSDQYYLAVCKAAGITPGTNGVPTCTSGNYCISIATNAGSQATCSYTTLQGDGSSNNWYAYACDKNASGACSAVDSGGTGGSESPFYVNHAPTFTVYADDSAKNPGATVTWTSTSSDSDSDNVTLYVCKTASFNGTTCAGGQWCNSTAVASNPTCNAVMDSVMQDKNYGAFGYIVDARGVQASGGQQGVDSVLTINNVAPTITASSIGLFDTDGSGDLTLTNPVGETSGFTVKFTVTDNNSCVNASAGNEIASALINVRRSGITAGNCLVSGDYNGEKCYPDAYASWTNSCVQDGASCSGNTDPTSTWTCTFPLQYYADATVAVSKFPSENWLADVKATDDNSSDTGWVTASTGTEMGQFLAYNLNTPSINYGSLDPGADATEQTTTLEARGNVGLDENLSGTDMSATGGTIAVGQQKYNLTASQGWGGTGSVALTTSGIKAELNLAKPKTGSLTPTKNTYWVLRVPNPQATGSYSGTDTVEGIVADLVDW